MISWISGLACLAWLISDDWETELCVIVALGKISWGSGSALACGAPQASPEGGIFVCNKVSEDASRF